MTRYARALGSGMRRALSDLRRNPAATASVVVTTAVAFFLVGLMYTMGAAIDAATRSWQRAHMVLYLEPGVTPERASEIQATLAQLSGVVDAEYISPERALARFRESLAPHDPALEDIEAGLLPASVEVTLDARVREVVALAPTVERLRSMDGVEDVAFAEPWVDDMSAMRAGLHGAGVIAMVVMLALALYLATSALAPRLGARVREAAVARLLGASSAYVRGPLVLGGALQGALGAGLALLALWLFLAWIAPGAGEIFGVAAGRALALPQPGYLLVFICAGAALGACSTLLAGRSAEGRHALA